MNEARDIRQFALNIYGEGGRERFMRVVRNELGAPIYAFFVKDRSVGFPFFNTAYEVRKVRGSIASELRGKSEADEGDVHIFHDIYTIPAVDQESVPSIMFSHTAIRPYSFGIGETVREMDVVQRWALTENADEIRDEFSDWLSTPDQVAVNSEFIQSQLQRFFDIDSEVVYPPVDRNKFSPRDTGSKDYFFSAQRMAPHKRVSSQVEAFADLDESLVIAGGGKHSDIIEERVQPYDNITYIGRVSEDELVRRYNEAKAVIQTAKKEDFGFVPREAMACGTPAIVPNEGGFKEIPEDCAEKFDPEDRIDGLKKAVNRFDPGEYNPERLRGATERCSVAEMRQRFIKLFDEMGV